MNAVRIGQKSYEMPPRDGLAEQAGLRVRLTLVPGTSAMPMRL